MAILEGLPAFACVSHVMLLVEDILDSKDHGVNMGPTWVLSAPGGPQVGPMNLAIRDAFVYFTGISWAPTLQEQVLMFLRIIIL